MLTCGSIRTEHQPRPGSASMHDILRERLIRKIESLPEGQVYQILDYIEFLESKYGTDPAEETSGLRRFAEAVEDKLRKTSMSPATLREAFQLISAADKVLANVSSAGRKLMDDLTPGVDDLPVEDESHSVDERSAGKLSPTAEDEPGSAGGLPTEGRPSTGESDKASGSGS